MLDRIGITPTATPARRSSRTGTADRIPFRRPRTSQEREAHDSSQVEAPGFRPPYLAWMPAARTDRLTLRHPPLDELVIGVQFRDDVTDDAIALAEYWPKIRNSFPALQKQPPLPPASEAFESSGEAEPAIELLMAPPAPRYWFVSEDENRLVQLQPNRFFLNWRKRQPEDEYPRYDVLREEFRAHLGDLLDALPEDRRPTAIPTWCELTYINHVDAAAKRKGHRPLADILRLVSAPPLRALSSPEDTQLQQRHVVFDDGKRPIGRVYITAAPALRSADKTPIYALTLLARLEPRDPTVDGVMATLDEAHRLLLPTFTDVTRPRMHAEWGLEEPDD